MPKNCRVRRSKNVLFNFYLLQKDKKYLLGLNIISSTRKHKRMKLRTYRKLKNFILKHYLCNSEIFLSCSSSFLNNTSVGTHEKLFFFFFFFLEGNKNCRVGIKRNKTKKKKKKTGSVGLAETQVHVFFRPNTVRYTAIHTNHDTTKCVFGRFRPGQTQTGLRSHRS